MTTMQSNQYSAAADYAMQQASRTVDIAGAAVKLVEFNINDAKSRIVNLTARIERLEKDKLKQEDVLLAALYNLKAVSELTASLQASASIAIESEDSIDANL